MGPYLTAHANSSVKKSQNKLFHTSTKADLKKCANNTWKDITEYKEKLASISLL